LKILILVSGGLLIFFAQGGQGKEKKVKPAAKKFASPSDGAAEGVLRGIPLCPSEENHTVNKLWWCLLDEIRTFLTKIQTANFDCRASRGKNKNFSARAGKKEGGWGEEFLPALAFAASFFAAAVFRISLYEMRRQEVLPLSYPPIHRQ